MKYVSTPILNNPAGALAQALIVPVGNMYIDYVIDMANRIAYDPVYKAGVEIHYYC